MLRRSVLLMAAVLIVAPGVAVAADRHVEAQGSAPTADAPQERFRPVCGQPTVVQTADDQGADSANRYALDLRRIVGGLFDRLTGFTQGRIIRFWPPPADHFDLRDRPPGTEQ